MPIQLDLSKCTGCKLCQLACSAVLEGVFNPEKARLKIVHEYLDTGIHIAAAQCTFCRKCEKACPQNAISNNGAWMIVDKKKCVGCGTCIEECPTKIIFPGQDRKSVICDLCEGRPKCAEWCPKEVISVKIGRTAVRRAGNE